MRRPAAVIGLLWAAQIPFLSVADAQSGCSIALDDAEKLYRTGHFDAVVDAVEPCLHEAGTGRGERVEAYRLLALAGIAGDDPQGALGAVDGLLALKPDFEATLRDPPRFARIIDEVRRRRSATEVTSVSKNSEDVRLTPATVLVLSNEEIRRRGYADLEAVLHDLPGFDISRGNGVLYSNIYQRGYRANGTDRTLFLYDDVEENDLWSNFANISRQYPLSNIKRIEVIYGPASTMYGPNAYAGVINVITANGDDLIEPGRRLGLRVQSGSGTYVSRYVDVTGAARHKKVSISVSVRVYHSDEADLSAFPDWDYLPHDAEFYQEKLAIRGLAPDGAPWAERFLEQNPQGTDHPYTLVVRNASGQATAIEISDVGAQSAADHDAEALQALVQGRSVGFANDTDDWSVSSKLRLGDLQLGMQTWRRDEGSIGWFPDDREGSSRNGGSWIPRHTFLYAKYEMAISEAVDVEIFTRYKIHALDNDNQIVSHQSYSGEGRLGLADLLIDTPAGWSTRYFFRQSKEMRSEAKMFYAPTAELRLLGGVELRSSDIQGQYNVSVAPNPSETGFPFAELNNYDQRNVGAYAQGTYSPRADLSLTLGGRVDNNRVRETLGFGTVFTPRVAAVYHPRDFIFKVIYAEAFKAPSNSARFSTSPSRQVTSPDLEPERVKNADLSAGWQITDNLFVDLVGYRADYSDIIGATAVVLEDGTTTTQNLPIGALRIRGLQGGLSLKADRHSLYANYSYTDPQNVEVKDATGNILLDESGRPVRRRIGDIASQRVNIGGFVNLSSRLDLACYLRYVGDRRTGSGTTVPDNPLDQIDAYTIIGGNLTVRGGIPGVSLQLHVDNALDTDYYHPGVRSAEGEIHVSRLPQKGREVMLRLLYADW